MYAGQSGNDSSRYTYDEISEAAKYILNRTYLRPKIAIYCGGGLAYLSKLVVDCDEFYYEDIPSFPMTNEPGHESKLIIGKLCGIPVLCMLGRFHYYEGFSLAQCTMPVKVMKLIGITHLIAPNTAGSINPAYKIGDIMLMKDHINIMGFGGNNPLHGPNDERFGPRFPVIYKAYDTELLKVAKEFGSEMNLQDIMHEGIYICLGGPNFESVAELKMLESWEVDAVGMSTIHEIVTARHCDIACFSFSVITNICNKDYGDEDDVDEIVPENLDNNASLRQGAVEGLVKKMVKFIHEDKYTFEMLTETANYILERTKLRPKIGIICGSGLGSLSRIIEESESFPYHTIPHFPVATVVGHESRLTVGHVSDVPVMCMEGRFHYYEGYPLSRCSLPIRVMKMIGITHLIISNAAGGLNDDYDVGDIMLIKDHINMMGFAGNNPLLGPNDDRFGPRFPTVTKAYDSSLVKKAKEFGEEMGVKLHEGVYICIAGPNYESVAELRMFKRGGADAVGMSTVYEVITACHCGLKCFAFSLISSRVVMDYDVEQSPCHEAVIEVGRSREATYGELVKRMISYINESENAQN